MLPVDDLIPYVNNAKKHPVSQVNQIVESIERFGFNDPIGIWHNEDGEPEIVEGHGRLMAAKRMGMTHVPTIALDHLTDDERRAFCHIHNQLTLNSDTDQSILAAEIEALSDIDFSVFDMGIDYDDFGALDLDDDPSEQDSKQVDTAHCPKCGFVFEV